MTRLRHLLALPLLAALLVVPTRIGELHGQSVAHAGAAPAGLIELPTLKPHASVGIDIDPTSVIDGPVAVSVASIGPFADAEVTITAAGAVRLAASAERVTVGAAPRRVSGASASVSGAGQITATITGTSADGQRATVSDTVWVDRVGDRVLVSEIGTQDRELRRVDALAALDMLPTEVTDALRATAIGGRAELVEVARAEAVTCNPGFVCVDGTAVWTDRDGTTRPIPGADVEVREANAGGDVVVATTRTAADGSFSAVVDNVDPEGGQRDIVIRLLASGDGFAFVRSTGGSNLPTQYVDTPEQSDVANGVLPVSIVTNNLDDNHTVFSLHHAMYLTREYLPALQAAPFPDIDVVYPAGGSFYDGNRLNMLRADRWDWDVMLHEYGHFVSDVLNTEDSPGGRHSGQDNLADDFGRDKDEGIRLAWGEGWATYFAISLLQEADAAALGIANIGDARYQDTEDASIDSDLEAHNTLGEDNEVTVMSVLWDLYDSVDDGIDEASLGAQAVWSGLDDSDPSTLSDVYAAFAPDAGAAHDLVNCVFSQMNVAPRLTGPAMNVIDASAPPPLLEWSPGNGGINGENDEFDVEFRSASDGAVLHRSGLITDTAYQPASEVWSAVLAASDGEVIVTVVGTETQNPMTGPYRSCESRFVGEPQATSALFTELDPARFVDTRPNGETIDDRFVANGERLAGDTLSVEFAGRGGVPADARGVIVNLTAARPADVGFVTAFACDDEQPLASSLNFAAQSNVANEVIVSLDSLGSACFFTSVDMHVVIDVVGYVAADSLYRAVEPARFLDTRTNGQVTVDGESEGLGRVEADTDILVTIAGRADVPDPISAVVVNVTAVGAERTGYVTVHACESEVPFAASLNYVAGVNRGNEVVVPVDGDGDICLYTSEPVHLTADVVGYVPLGSDLESTLPSRLFDSRPTGQTVDGIDEATGMVAADSSVRIQVASRAGVPAQATAAVMNITTVQPDGTGFVTVWPCSIERPTVSSVNHIDLVNGGNEIIAKLDVSGGVCIYASNDTHLTVDVTGSLGN